MVAITFCLRCSPAPTPGSWPSSCIIALISICSRALACSRSSHALSSAFVAASWRPNRFSARARPQWARAQLRSWRMAVSNDRDASRQT
jgi:hypothetical protein